MKNNNPTNEMYVKILEWLSIYHSDSEQKEKDRVKALIVTQMYPVVKNIARTIARRAYDPIDDLVQAGFIGLLKAIERFNSSKNDNFRVYAGYLIIGEMKHYLRDKLNTIRVPRHIQELSIRIHNFTKTLTPEEVQDLTSDEVASALEISPKAVDFVMQVDRRRTTLSLEDVFKSDETNMNYEDVLGEGNFEEKSNYEDVRIIFEDAINRLPDEEKVLVDMFYHQDMTKKDIAEALLLTPMAVSRKLKQAFELIADIVKEYNNGELH
ncbi:sigma-70 family RNA polymerase sigma factor [bacterium]|nr:sigma-70 family RNA polymerase sigma factor [bacterium]